MASTLAAMAKAMWNGNVVAESDNTVVVDGNHYFPADSLKREFFAASDYRTTCPWKGVAHYYNVSADGKTSENGAWYYPETKPKAANILNHVAFWNGVTVDS